MIILTLAKSRQPQWEAWSCKHLFHEYAIALSHALDNSTLNTYSSHLQSYLTFCKLHNFPLEPTLDTLSFYVVFMAHHIKLNSVSQYLSGIISTLEPYFPIIWEARLHTHWWEHACFEVSAACCESARTTCSRTSQSSHQQEPVRRPKICGMFQNCGRTETSQFYHRFET